MKPGLTALAPKQHIHLQLPGVDYNLLVGLIAPSAFDIVFQLRHSARDNVSQ
jgi:hypothetical protein